MVRRGVQSLVLNDNVVLTDLAYEEAKKQGMQLVREKPQSASPSAARAASTPNGQQTQPPAAPAAPAPQADVSALHQKIRSAVISGLGNKVDPGLVDVIISRVLH